MLTFLNSFIFAFVFSVRAAVSWALQNGLTFCCIYCFLSIIPLFFRSVLVPVDPSDAENLGSRRETILLACIDVRFPTPPPPINIRRLDIANPLDCFFFLTMATNTCALLLHLAVWLSLPGFSFSIVRCGLLGH